MTKKSYQNRFSVPLSDRTEIPLEKKLSCENYVYILFGLKLSVYGILNTRIILIVVFMFFVWQWSRNI